MDTTPPRSSPSASVRVTSPLVNAKILQVPLETITVSSVANQRTSPPSKIPQPITGTHMVVTSEAATTNHRMAPGRSHAKSPSELVLLSNRPNNLQKIGNGPVAMTSKPQQPNGPTVVQPIITRGCSNLPTVVTVQGPVPHREYNII